MSTVENKPINVIGAVEQIAKHENNRYGLKIAGIWFNGFGSVPAEVGQTIDFDYVEQPKDNKPLDPWRNIRFINKVMDLDGEPIDSDFKTAKELIKESPYNPIILENDEKNRNYMIMKASVDLCLARKTFTDEEIFAQYKRLLKAMEAEHEQG